MSNIRTFIAVDVSAGVRTRTAELIRRLQACGVKANWTKNSNLHLTLKFLGEIPDRRVPDVCRAITQSCADFAPMRLNFRGAGAFPRHERPRTVWIGVEPETDQLAALQEAIESHLYELGFPRERRRFKPHLTIGRVRSGGPEQQELGRLIQENCDFTAGSCQIEQVLAYGSFLDKSGPTYQVLGRAPLVQSAVEN